ncbi:MAG: CoA transferase [Deltaproteobacteria bacterium]|nr:CoA transferase [Deltaproteobacteria bacterium]
MVAQTNGDKKKKMPLEGLRFIEFSWIQAGPWVGRYFANFGAEVIRIESAKRLDWARNVPGRPDAVEGRHRRGALFTNFNCDKYGITLNLRHPKGIELARKLVSIGDIVADNFSAGFMDKIGLGYNDLIKIKPDIIQLSMPVFGKTGPRRKFGAYGNGIQATIGLNTISGFPHRPPAINIALPDVGANPTHACVALLAALHYRQRTGKGQYIELPQLESSLCWMDTTVLDYTVNGRVTPRLGNRSPYAAPHGAFRCAGEDRWCAIAVTNEKQWGAFCGVMGNPAWSADPKFSSLAGRKENEDELEKVVEEWTKVRTAEDVMRLLQSQGVPAGICQTGEDLMLRDEYVKARECFKEMPYGDGKALCENIFIGMSETPGEIRRAGPMMGQDNEHVYRNILGLSEEELNELYVEGALD